MEKNSLSDMKDAFQVSVLEDEIRELKKTIVRYEKTLGQYSIDEIENISDIEYICIEEIKKLKALSNGRGLTEDEIKSLDVLHKNLRQCVKDQEVNKKKLKEKEADVSELLSIVNGEN